MSELTGRLRQRAMARVALKRPSHIDKCDAELDSRAADRIAALEAEVERLTREREQAIQIAKDVAENGEYHGEANVDTSSSIYQQGAFEVWEAIAALRALASEGERDG